jgi:DNA mismatch repair protein MutL
MHRVGKVAILPPIVQGQIAAGEVIERPASVVKELVENALDAAARHVEVSLRGGGIDRIAVRDDGEGMAPDDALLAFARHGTSKLAATEELERVTTLGFRGEALPSIAAASSVRLMTRRAEDPAGIAIEADGAGARVAGPAGTPPGTAVEVRDLFATTPARRKFLRTTSTEVGHVVDLLTRLAVACPQTGFRLEHDGREVVAYPPVRGLRERLAQVLGAERAGSMIGCEAAGGGLALTAFLGPPRESLSTTRLVWTFVSLEARPGEPSARRWVRDRLLLRAVLDGYESLLMRGRYPVAMLFLATAPGELDVNVHPAKLEVRFRRPQAVHQIIVSALRARLATALGPPAPAGVAEGTPPRWGSAGSPRTGPLSAADAARSSPTSAPAERPAATQASLWQPAPDGFASLRFVGQVLDGYLLCEGVDRVVLLDQHAAHERVRFERLRAEHAAGSVARDGLLVPETIALPPVQLAALAENERMLASLGLEGEVFGDGTFLLRTVPRLLRGQDVGELVRALASELAEQGASLAGARAVDAVLATMACHSAVRVGQRLTPEQVRALLDAMDTVDVNAHCPHGRPVAVELSRARLESLFGR